MSGELPGPVVDVLMSFHRCEGTPSALIGQLQRDLAGAGWRLVPETAVPRAEVLGETPQLMRWAAQVDRPPSGILPCRFEELANSLDYFRELAAAILGIDLSALAELAEGDDQP